MAASPPREAAGLLVMVMVVVVVVMVRRRRRSTNAVPTALALAKAPRVHVVGVKLQLEWSNSVQRTVGPSHCHCQFQEASCPQARAGMVAGATPAMLTYKNASVAIIDVRAKQDWTRLVPDVSVRHSELTPELL